MDKIATTMELQRELSKLINYAGSPRPSRIKLASKLRTLSYRVAADDAADDAADTVDKLKEAYQRLDELQTEWGQAHQAYEKAINAPWGERTRQQRDKDIDAVFKKTKQLSKALKAAHKAIDKLLKSR